MLTSESDEQIQSVYPMRYSDGNFKYRFSDDVRDGYAELLPDKKVHFENVHRKMIDRAVQSGASKVTEEQQTDPTFPTNAWSQYLYELEEAETKTDDAETLASVDEKKEEEISFISRKKKEPVVEEEVIPVEPEISQQVEDLLQTLEFNQVDMYRDDYKFIGKEEVAKYNTPFLEELCCFANIAKCRGRHIISMDWHPEISGVCVAAYGYELKTRKVVKGEMVDVIKRAIIDSNPILIWSFDDPLYPKLELESIREISCISFCPYDGNIIVGGTVNGQIIIWDLKNRFESIETETIFTPTQQKHRNEIRENLKWNVNAEDSNNKIVLPAVVSNIERSHEMAITGIKWLAQNYQCTRKVRQF
jgi:dynein intermediate chain 3, axonemal